MESKTMDFKNDSEDIQFLLQGQFDNCSRQRLRAIEISLNRYSNSDHRMSSKDVHLALQENDIHLPERIIKKLCDFYSDNRGVNYQAVHQCLQVAHSRTGRDSIVAWNRKPTRRHRSKEEQMEDLIQRLRTVVLGENGGPIDVDKLEKFLAGKDKDKSSLLPKEEILFFLNDFDLSIYGALLDVLVSSLPDIKNSNLIRWRQVLNVIRMIQNNVDTSHVMSILMSTDKGRFQTKRHIRVVCGSRPQPPADELHTTCKISTPHLNRQGNAQRDFDLSTRIDNQSTRREFHGPGWARPEPRKPVISSDLLNSPPNTQSPVVDARGGSIRNDSLIPKTKSLSGENANSFDGLADPASTDNVRNDKK